MGFWEIYLYVVIGILFSVIMPILRQSLPKPKGRLAEKNFRERILPIAKPYIILGIFSLVVGAFIAVVFADALTDSARAMLAGFTWDSILQKADPLSLTRIR